jgi:hypothetical protein
MFGSERLQSDEAARWVGRLLAIVEEMEDFMDVAELRAASSVNLKASMQSVQAIFYRALARAERRAPAASRLFFGCLAGTFSPSRRHIRSTRFTFTAHPASRRSP